MRFQPLKRAAAIFLAFMMVTGQTSLIREMTVVKAQETIPAETTVVSEERALPETTETGMGEAKETLAEETAGPRASEPVIKPKSITPAEGEVGVRSIIPVTEKVLDYRFYLAEGGEVYHRQIVKNGEKLIEPATPQDPANGKFEGWFIGNGNTQPVFDQPVTIPADNPAEQVIEVYARFRSTRVLTFYQDGHVVDTREVAVVNGQNPVITDAMLDGHQLTPVPGMIFMYWALDEAGTQRVQPNETTIPADMNLYAYMQPGYLVSFVSNGGTSYAPFSVLKGETVDAQAYAARKPDKPGYYFAGWYTDETLASAFDPTSPINAPVTLYAKWEPAPATYTIVYMHENANDDGFTYFTSEQRSGTTGTQVDTAAISNNDWPPTGFNPATVDAGDYTIKGDGSTVIKARRTRKTWTLTTKIREKGGSWFFPSYHWVDGPSYSGIKYEQKVSAAFADLSTRYPGYMWASSEEARTFYSDAPDMPDGNLTIWGKKIGDNERTIRYLENGTDIKIKDDYVFNADVTALTIEDYISIPGFTVIKPETYPAFDWQGIATIYYTRNSYKISFTPANGQAAFDSDPIPYQGSTAAAFSGIGYEKGVTTYNNLVFDGWYDNPAFTGEEYTGTGTMPANNLALYAKWIPVQHEVRVHHASDLTSDATKVNVSHGEVFAKPDLEHDYPEIQPPQGAGEFLGWFWFVDGKFVSYDFSLGVTSDIDLYPVWAGQFYSVVYSMGQEGLTPPQDNALYQLGADAVVLPYEGTVPEGKTFVGWTLNGTLYYPYTKVSIISANITDPENKRVELTAVWSDIAETTQITYDANGGHVQNKPDETSKTFSEILNNGTHEVKGQLFVRPNYEFLGWDTDKTSKDPKYHEGSVIRLDTENQATANVLYAIWHLKKITIDGTKTWVNGPASRPETWLQLFRKAEGETAYQAVPNTIKHVPVGTDAEVSVSWEGQDAENSAGQTYSYEVREVNAAGEDFTPANYEKSVNGLNVTNTYLIPKASVQANKVWVNGAEPRPVIWFKLYRKVGNGAEEAVPNAGVFKLEKNNKTAKWDDIEQTTLDGKPYTFSVKEVNEEGQAFTPSDYTKAENGLTVTNTYESPANGTATATKTWVNGPTTRPTIWFKLYRHIEGGQDEAVPGAPIKELVSGTTSVTWTGLTEKDANARPYIFTVKEVDSDGDVSFMPDNYTKVEDGLTVTNTYQIPKAPVQAEKIWVNGAEPRPVIWFKLYRKVGNGAEEAVPNAGVFKLEKNNKTAKWDDIEQTTPDGKPYSFSVKEVNAQGEYFQPDNYIKGENGLTVTNTYRIPKAPVQAEKIWVNGAEPRPVIWFKLYRKVGNGAEEAVPNAGVFKLENKNKTAKWEDIEQTTLDGKPYTFSVKEVNEEGQAFTPSDYTKVENGLTVTNTYKSPTNGTATATKTWVNGPTTRPTIWFKLFRHIEGGQDEAVPGAPIKELVSGTTSVTWTGLQKTDLSARPYIFSVKEVNAQGEDFKPDNYNKDENGLTVTNTYQSPTNGTATATKKWVNGSTTRPTIWFKLYRHIEGGQPEAVPLTEAPLKELPSGTTSVTWTGLTENDPKGRPYIFSVRELDKDGNELPPSEYTKDETGLTVTNTYKSPTNGTATATKKWVNGADPRPTIWFKLYRHIEGGPEEAVPLTEAPLKELPNGTTSVTWTGLTEKDPNARPYIFSVKEVDKDGNDLVLPEYTGAADGLTVTNTYKSPTNGTATATKTWVNGPTTRPTIWFKLYRHIEGSEAEAVPLTEAPLKELPSGTTSVTWTGLTEKDANARKYIFTVKEVDSNGNVLFMPDNYTKVEDGLTVTNTYQSPTNGTATATKKWVNGAEPRPTIWFKLYRHIEGGQPEAVPLTEAPLKELPNGTTSVTWTGLTEKDLNARPYIFSVKEVDKDGNDLELPEYTVAADGLTVTNTYKSPTNGTATATKVWVNGAEPRPTIWFKLFRHIEGSEAEAVPLTEAPLKELVNGTTSVTWTGLTEKDANARKYIFTVKEVDSNGNVLFMPDNYTKVEDGLTVTNTYESPTNETATATKVWVNGPTTHPTVWFKLYRHIEGGQDEAVPGAPIKELVSGTTSVTWTGLQKTDLSARPYIFSVKEVDATGKDYTPTNYTKTEGGLKVTNSYVIPTDGTAAATKKWVNGPTTRPTVWFKLYREIEGGTAVPVPGAEVKKLENGTTTVAWTGLEKTDLSGKPYIFSVKEFNAQGENKAPANYAMEEEGLKVTNSYLIPTDGTATAAKVWVNGPTPRPTVWFKLYRETEGGAAVPVPGAEVKKLENGTTTVAWTGLEKTDLSGKPYIFSVREFNEQGENKAPANYAMKEEGLTVTNSYVIPTDGTAAATKKWVNGPTTHPTIWLKLYRKVTGGTEEAVPGAELKKLVSGTETAEWTGLEKTDLSGKPYIFSVKEFNAQGENKAPANYTMKEEGLTVTNSYVIPTDKTATATKVWVNGPTTHPTVWFKLYRAIPGGTAKPVPGAEVKKLENGTTTVEWTGLEKTDLSGNEYIFSVIETDEHGNDSVPVNYVKTENGLLVTNTYQSPQNASAKAFKTWQNGPADRPDIWFRLYREALHTPKEPVPLSEAPIKKLPSGTTEVVWTNLTKTNSSAEEYIFSVQEVDAAGKDYKPANYTKTEKDLTVTNSYVIPTDGTATATKVWENGPAAHPTVWFKLYRAIEGGAAEPVPGAEVKKLENGTTTVAWTGLEKTDLNGKPYIFSVKEFNAQGENKAPANYAMKEEGLKVTNSYVIPTDGTAIGTKVWVNGPDGHPTVWFKLYRAVGNGKEEAVPGAELKKLVSGTETAEWTGLEKTDLSGNEYIFSVKEVNEKGEDFRPEHYTKKEVGLVVTNTYVIPNHGKAKGEKVWQNGPADHPTIWFKLMRQIQGGEWEDVPEAALRKLPNGTLTAEWTGLDETDSFGRAYSFAVKEVNAKGEDFEPDNYHKTEDGLTVTNSYVIPTDGTAEAEKAWVDGPATHPTIWFKLMREISGGKPEAVPDAELMKLENGTLKVSWTGLERTDINGNPYTFSVREVDENGVQGAPANYTCERQGLKVTNTYVSPMNGRAEALKVWENGPDGHPTVYFKLYRAVENGAAEEVPGAAVKTLVSGVTRVEWTGLRETDSKGRPYVFSVKEFNAQGENKAPVNYTMKEEGLTVTNSYVIPTDGTADAVKEWVNGPDRHPTVWFRLYREIKDGTAEPVPGAELKKLENGTVKVSWTGLEKTDLAGNPYIFSVREVNEKGENFTPEHYSKIEAGLKVTNRYVIPTDGRAVAAKVWENGPDEHPTVWLKLYRQTKPGTAESVPGAKIQELVSGTTTAEWTGLEKTDLAGNPYTFFVKEVNAKGDDFTPEHYTKKEVGLVVTNTYVIPNHGSARGEKVWQNGPADHPTIWFKLMRQIQGGEWEDVPEAALRKLPNGTLTAAWTGLDETDLFGRAYLFKVAEVNEKGEDFVPVHYQKTEEGLKVTNSYVIPTDGRATGVKVWLNGPDERPTIWFELLRQIGGGKPEAVPGAERKELKNGVTEVTWTGLEVTDINGRAYIFSVKEVDKDGRDTAPANYAKTEKGLTVTNSYVIPKAKVEAEKIWADGPAKHPTIWFRLMRQLEGGKPEAVPGAALAELKDGTLTAVWENVDQTDINGRGYTFTAREVNEKGEDFVPVNYQKTEDGLKVTNTYVIPTNGEAKAEKVWVNGPAKRPTVWLRLYRQVKDGKPEAVPGAELKKLADGTLEAVWTGLEETDKAGRPYTFSVREVNAKGEDFTPEHYSKKEEGLRVTNTYVIPTNGEAKALKIWAGGAEKRPDIWFKLFRQIENGKPEAVPGAELKKLAGGTLEAVWTGLEETDKAGRPYTFSVREVNAKGEDFVPVNYQKTEEGLKVTNTYVIPTNGKAEAEKVWVGAPETTPTIWLKLFRRTEGGKEEAVPGAAIKELVSGVTKAAWDKLEATDISGRPYTFSVREVDAKGNAYVPDGYEKVEDGLKVTNTFIVKEEPEEVTKTGESSAVYGLAAMTLLASAALVVYRRKFDAE